MEKQKRHLAYMMAYGKDMPPTPHGPKILHRARKLPRVPDDQEVFDERKLKLLSIVKIRVVTTVSGQSFLGALFNRQFQNQLSIKKKN